MKTIKHASEIYPTASKWFLAGIHTYFTNGERPTRPCNDDYMYGFNTAETENLKSKYIFKPF